MDPSHIIRDPSTTNSRIYVGNLADNCRKDVEECFSQFGVIAGIILNRGFGFIQYENEENAQKAIQAQNGNVFLGRKLIVRNAQHNPVGPEKRIIGSSRESGVGGSRETVGRESTTRDANRDILGSNWRNRGRDRSPIDNDRDRDSNDWNYYGRNSGSFDSNDYSNRTAGSFSEPYVKPAEHNDCEIIVVSKTLTEYAESIESHLKRMGLSVDLLFPNDDVPIGKVLANISSRGSLYAILVTPQNEEHRSITVNILYGTPAEHRNMPVEDAINFIVANFQEKIKQEKLITTPSSIACTTPTLVAPPLTDRHPDTVQTLVNLLANNRSLTVLQYDRIIKYLQERRELQVKAELGESCPTPIIPTITNQELELQQKILSILNKPSITATIQPEVPIVPNTTLQTSIGSSSSSNVLFDPVVQKALDSILQTNFYFKR